MSLFLVVHSNDACFVAIGTRLIAELAGGPVVYPSNPVTVASPFKLTIIELCCSKSSKLGSQRYCNREVRVIRVTEEEDFRNSDTVREIRDILHDPMSGRVIIYVSLPCTYGCSWKSVNRSKDPMKHDERQRVHLSLFKKLFRNLESLFDDMLKVKYQGIRPAPGYPTQPDHTEKNLLW